MSWMTRKLGYRTPNYRTKKSIRSKVQNWHLRQCRRGRPYVYTGRYCDKSCSSVSLRVWQSISGVGKFRGIWVRCSLHIQALFIPSGGSTKARPTNTNSQFRRNLASQPVLVPGDIALDIRPRLRPQHTVKPAKMRRSIAVKVSQKP